ncbi:MAG TPA: hypothetical protein VG222_09990 [Vicinamibacterales bacterium]|nr:hypothetical protein [Vicinamibacterales bacterium]
MTIFPMVMNSRSLTGLSLHRRCVIASAPMLPASATTGPGRPIATPTLLRAKCASPQPWAPHIL